MQHITALTKLKNMYLCGIKSNISFKIFYFDTDKSPVSITGICKIRRTNMLIVSSSLPIFSSVADLKHAIQTKYKIAIQHQVLVVNGGECMAPDRRVCSYSAGTVSAYCISHFNCHV